MTPEQVHGRLVELRDEHRETFSAWLAAAAAEEVAQDGLDRTSALSQRLGRISEEMQFLYSVHGDPSVELLVGAAAAVTSISETCDVSDSDPDVGPLIQASRRLLDAAIDRKQDEHG